jgi:hypothetical protein
MVHLGSSPPRIGLTWASQEPRKVGIWHGAASALTPRGSRPGKPRDKQQHAEHDQPERLDLLACSGLGGDPPAARGAGPKEGTST